MTWAANVVCIICDICCSSQKERKKQKKKKSQSCHVSTINLFMVVTISSIFYVIGEVLYAVHTGFFTDVDTVLKIIHVDL